MYILSTYWQYNLDKMKNNASLAFVGFLWSCSPTQTTTKQNDVAVTIDLINVKDDKVLVTVTPPTFTNRNSYISLSKNCSGNILRR